MSSATIRVCDKVELEIEYNRCRAEPDVGIMSDYVDEWCITAINGRAYSKRVMQRAYRLIDKHKYTDYIEEQINSYIGDSY